MSPQSVYTREAREHLREAGRLPLLTEKQTAHLPDVVQQYIRRSGALGQPQVAIFKLIFHGRIRSGPRARWMPFCGQQQNTYGPISRIFLMNASMFGLPFQALHRFSGASATMQVKIASLFTVVDASGPEMSLAETVTLLNDMCLFAPGALIDPNIRWQEVDAHTVTASFTHCDHTIQATLVFNGQSELVDFTSDDRMAASRDGKSFVRRRWSTPVREHALYDSHLVVKRGDAAWHSSEGEFTYLELELDAIQYNVADIVS